MSGKSKIIDDFGFSFEEDIQRTSIEKFSEYEKIVKSFLTKLQSNPSKEIIKWPQRSSDIEQLITTLDEISKEIKGEN